MSKLLILCLTALAITGCQSTKPPMAKGKWTTVNMAGFIPANVAKYSDNTATLAQPSQPLQSQGQSVQTVQKFPVAIERPSSAVGVTLVEQKKQDSNQ